MTRSFYSSAIFVSGLYILVILFQSIVYFRLEEQLPALQSITSWFVVAFLTSTFWFCNLLAYFYYKKYRITLWLAILYLAASLFQFYFLYRFLHTAEVPAYFSLSTLITQGMGIMYGLSLVFSEAGKRPWLRTVGVFIFFLEFSRLSVCILANIYPDVLIINTIAGMVLWAALIGMVAPVLFIVNFRKETQLAIMKHTSHQKVTVGFMNFGAFAALVLSLVFGFKVVDESFWLADNPQQVSEYLKQVAQPFEARIFINSEGDSLGYRLMKPLDYDSTRQYPVVVSLHGSSGCGKDNVRQVAAASPVEFLSSPENRIKYPAFLFVPQCPGQAVWGGIPGLPAIDSLVLEAMFSLEKEFSIDGKRRYVTGVSLGGYGAWHLITTRPNIFAAAMPICGAGNPALAQNIVALPVWAFHGAKDQNVPVRGSRNIIEAIKSAGGHPRYTEFPEKGHHIARLVTETPGLLDWLFAQKRK